MLLQTSYKSRQMITKRAFGKVRPRRASASKKVGDLHPQTAAPFFSANLMYTSRAAVCKSLMSGDRSVTGTLCRDGPPFQESHFANHREVFVGNQNNEGR